MAVKEVVNWGTDPDDQAADLDGFPNAFPARHTPARIREVLASLARWIKDIGGGLITAGTGSAYTLAATAEDAVYEQGPPDGSLYRARIHATIKSPATLKVRTAPARALYWPDGTRPAAGTLIIGTSVLFLYRASDTRFLVVAPDKPSGFSQSDWNISDNADPRYIKNKPDIPDEIPNPFEDVTRLFLG